MYRICFGNFSSLLVICYSNISRRTGPSTRGTGLSGLCPHARACGGQSSNRADTACFPRPSAFFPAPLQRSMDQVGLHRLGRPCPDRKHVRSARSSSTCEIDAHAVGSNLAGVPRHWSRFRARSPSCACRTLIRLRCLLASSIRTTAVTFRSVQSEFTSRPPAQESSLSANLSATAQQCHAIEAAVPPFDQHPRDQVSE